MTFWQNKSVAVTGGASGIGKALSIELARRGAKVWLSDINSDGAEAVEKEIGNASTASTLDTTDANAVAAHFDEIAKTHGRLNAVFNNAGIGVGGDMADLTVEHFNRCTDVNIRGVTNGVVAAYKHMLAQKGGLIVNTASSAGLLGVPLMAPYSMTKHAVVGLTTSMRMEAAENNIQVCALCPMAIETPILDSHPAGSEGIWRPDIRKYLTKVGGPPYPVDKFAAYALDQVERNKEIIVAPFGARVRIALARYLPFLVALRTRQVFRKIIAEKPGKSD